MTEHVTLSAVEVARRLSPADQPDLIKPQFVARRMASGRWPSRKFGRARVMTEADFQAALEIEYQGPRLPVEPRLPSGVSPRSRVGRLALRQREERRRAGLE